MHAIGFKTTVTLEDIVEILKVWTKSETPFKSRYRFRISDKHTMPDYFVLENSNFSLQLIIVFYCSNCMIGII